MNKKIKDTIIAIVLVSIILFLLGCCWNIEREYDRDVVITSIEDNTIYCQDIVGNVWAFSTSDHYEVGEFLILSMNDNATESNIKDDYIINIKRVQ